MADLAAYNHTQSSPSTTWTITHSLGTQDVAVDVMIYLGSPQQLEKAIPLTQVATSGNVVTITWSASQSGFARVVGGGDD